MNPDIKALAQATAELGSAVQNALKQVQLALQPMTHPIDPKQIQDMIREPIGELSNRMQTLTQRIADVQSLADDH